MSISGRADAVGLGDPVAGADQRVGRGLEGLTRRRPRPGSRLGVERLQPAVADVAGDRAGAARPRSSCSSDVTNHSS